MPDDFLRVHHDTYVKKYESLLFVIPAKAGIQSIQDVIDPCFRRGDGQEVFTPSLITAL